MDEVSESIGISTARGRGEQGDEQMKRFVDVVASGAAMLLLSPVLLVLAILVRVRLGAPVLFRQQRPGRNSVPFELLKFRTMSDALDSDGKLLPDADRMTSLGRWLRATSLDELPELWNVLRGDMSLVGPRPLLMSYVPLFNEKQARRHEVRPGMTGWAQINGRNETSWARRLELDVWYVDNRSMLLDTKIIAKTALLVLRRHGISAKGHSTMPEFRGTEDQSETSS